MSSVVKCLEDLGYRNLTELQKKAFDIVARKGKSVIIVAPTGSGKTEAAVFPIMYSISKNKLKPIAAIYITPLRALNRDIEERISRIGECFGLTVALRHGDTPSSARKRVFEHPPHILITTPESLNYLLVNQKFIEYLKNLEFIVIDEFREMMESKRGLLLFTVIYLLENLILGRSVKKIALTATLGNVDLALKLLGEQNGEVLIDTSQRKMEINVVAPSLDYATNYGVDKILEDKALASRLGYIIDVLLKNRGVLVFVNTRSLAERLGYLLSTLASKLGLEYLRVEVHHGSLSKQHRINVEREFKNGLIKGLIATSSMELGIDIGRVDYVIQYMSPRQVTRLVQRIGRSGHKLGGVARGSIVIADNMFQLLESLVLTRRAYANQLEPENVEFSPLDVLAYAVVLYTYVLGKLNKYELYHVITYFELYKNLSILEYESLLEYLAYSKLISVEGSFLKPSRRSLRFIYKVTMIPDTRNVDVIEVSSSSRVGVLNEEYVVLNVNAGDAIVLGGRTWRVVDYNPSEAKLYVEPLPREQEIIIPHWEGENIPVEYSVAREVGSIIRRLKTGVKLDEYYTIDFKVVEKYASATAIFGDDKTIVTDYNDRGSLIAVNAFGGSRVNRFLRDLFKTVLAKRFPLLEVRVHATPYAVFILFGRKPPPYIIDYVLNAIESALRELKKYLMEEALMEIATSQNTLYWRIYQVAQRFGAIDPGETRVTKSILAGFVDTIIGVEALKEVLSKDYDLESLRTLAELIERGAVKIIRRVSYELTEFHRELLEYIEVPQVTVLKPLDQTLYREKVLNRKVTLLCIRCGYSENSLVRDLINKPLICPRCRMRTVAVVKSDGVRERDVVLKAVRGEKLTSEEKRVLEDLQRRVVLLIEHGDLALIALSARGVRSTDVARIVSLVKSGEDLFRVLYEYEVKAVKAKKYFDERSQ